MTIDPEKAHFIVTPTEDNGGVPERASAIRSVYLCQADFDVYLVGGWETDLLDKCKECDNRRSPMTPIRPSYCGTCGRDPCFPWSDLHDSDFAQEIADHLLSEAKKVLGEQGALLADARSLIAGYKEKLQKIKGYAIGGYNAIAFERGTTIAAKEFLSKIEEECDT